MEAYLILVVVKILMSPINQHLIKQVKVSQMDDEDASQSLFCHNENGTAKKDVTVVDGLMMEKLDLLCDGEVTMPTI